MHLHTFDWSMLLYTPAAQMQWSHLNKGVVLFMQCLCQYKHGVAQYTVAQYVLLVRDLIDKMITN